MEYEAGSMLISCSTYIWTLKMEAIYSSETSVGFHQTTRRYVPEDRSLQMSESVASWLI
jgi:hypothetical protein